MAIDFRTFLVSFVRRLEAEEVYEVAVIWLQGKRDVSAYAPSNEHRKCGLELFTMLECQRVFSWKNIDGLMDIAKRINRFDLVDEVKDFIKKKGKTCGTRYTKKKSFSEERQHLEKAFESIVTETAVLQQHISLLHRALEGSDGVGTIDEGIVIVENLTAITTRLASQLSDVQKKLIVNRSRSSSDTSKSSDGGSRRNSGEVGEMTPFPAHISSPPQVAVSAEPMPSPSARNKPVPAPRKQKNRLQEPKPPIQESKENVSRFVHPASRDEGNLPLTCVLPFPVRSKKATLPLSPSNPPPVPQSTASRMCHLKVMLEDDYNDDDEGTGDSGVGTGTGSAECGDRSVWKSAMKRPPSVKPKKKRYATLREETAQEDMPYQQWTTHRNIS